MKFNFDVCIYVYLFCLRFKAEDPTVFQYDEVYDDIENKRKEVKEAKKSVDKKPKYIGKLLETADKRKKENERRLEKQVQKVTNIRENI